MHENSTLNILKSTMEGDTTSLASEGMSEVFGSGGSVDIKEIRETEDNSSNDFNMDDLDHALTPEAGEEQSAEQDEVPSEGDSSDDVEAKGQKTQPSDEENVEWLTTVDHKGRTRKVKVDYDDRNSVKRAYELAAGARKWQIERDDVAKQLSEYRQANEDKINNWNTIESVFQESGVQGLVNYLEGSNDAFDRLVEEAYAEKEWRKTADPAEVKRLDEQRAKEREAQQQQQQMEALQKQLEEFKQQQAEKEDQIVIKELQTVMAPAFTKYRFAGKLGNPTREHKIDKMIWDSAKESIAAYPDNVEITPALADRVFKEAALEIRELINLEADKKTNKTMKQKKDNAMSRAQASTSKALSPSGNDISGKASDMLKQSGRLADFFRLAAKKNPDGFMR